MLRSFRLLPFLLLSVFFCTISFAQEKQSSDAETASVDEAGEFVRVKEETIDRLGEAMNLDFGGNSVSRWGLFLAIVFATLIARKITMILFSNWLNRLAKKTKWTIDDKMVPALAGPVGAFVFIIGLFLALSVLNLSPTLSLFVLRIFQASTLTVVFWALLRVVDVFAEVMVDVAKERDMGVYHFIPLIKKTARIFLIVIAVVLVVQNLGYSVGSLLAGMGIGGLALALAAQESLSNFFGSVSIVADRPFKVGDWIQVGSRIDGDVEEIGLRSTKVRTWSKSQLTIPNKVLANEIIENWSRMPKRRVKQYIGVTYSTSPENMEGLVEDIRKLLRSDEDVNQDFILVNFTDFGDSALQILVYYFTKTTKWLEYMDIRQRINLEIMKLVTARGSSMAFPTRTLHLDGEIAERIAGMRP